MGGRAKPAKVKAEAKRPLARKAPKQEAPGIHELEKRLAEALEQQAATAEILKVISSSPTDIQPVLDAVAESAARLCDASDVVIRQVDGDVLRLVAHTGSVPVGPGADPSISRTTFAGRAIFERRTIHIHDVLEPHVREEYPDARFLRQPGHYRTALCAPLLREDTAIGTILIRRPEVRPFSDKQIKLLETFADQAVIAIENVRLFKELQARNVEVTESLERQTATADILSVISSSPTDLQPVFDAILEKAIRLCDAHMGNLGLYDGEMYQTVAQRGANAEYAKFLSERGAFRPPRGGVYARMTAERQPIHVADTRDSPEYRDGRPGIVKVVELGGARTYIAVPMLKEGRVVGGITIYRPEVRAFTQKQIDLVSTFANQAVIAIENVRLFNETKEALEQQTATAGILRVISSSPTDTQPVFDAIVKSGVRLFDGLNVTLRLVKGDRVDLVASTLAMPEVVSNPLNDDRHVTSRTILRRQVVQVPDVPAEDWVSEATKQRAAQRGYRAIVSAPMLREGNAIGAIAVTRATPGSFTDKEIALLKTFADQAVIAIENVRLFNETKEALEQQTATAEILRVISSSPTDVQPVLDAVAENATRVCEAGEGVVLLIDDGAFRVAAHYGTISALAHDEAIPITRGTVPGRAILERAPVHVPDLLAAGDDFPEGRVLGARFGNRTTLATPLLREGTPIGALLIRRTDVRPFTDKQIALLQTFASQAVIAIENVRLFNETKEALEQQTATAEILKVISSSPTDIQPVFDAILENATRLCGAQMANLGLYDGELFQDVAQRGVPPALSKFLLDQGPHRFSSDSGIGRMIAERQPVQFEDLKEGSRYRDGRNPIRVALIDLGGVRTYLAVPMLKEGRVVGGIVVFRQEVRPFTQKQIDLVSTFASQAVIAIENVRLFNETKEALEQQTVTAEILRVISSSPTDTQPVFDAIVKSGLHLFGGLNVSLRLVKGDQTELTASTRPIHDSDALFNPLNDDRVPSSRAILRREVVQIPDIVAEDWVREETKERTERRGTRAMMVAPMLRENEAIGSINVARATPGLFTDKQIALLKTFADQAVIAIENVRLFKELEARNVEITESLEQQTATAEILKVISSSPTDIQPVFDAILENATRLCDAHFGMLGLYDGEKYQHVAHRGGDPAFLEHVYRGPFNPDSTPTLNRMITERQAIHIPNLSETPGYRNRIPTTLATFELGGVRSVLAVPMMKEGRVVGGIFIYRPEVRPFTQKQIDLLSTFASQAVIAIENVRLFNETKEALEQQTVISEILRVISSSPTEVQPVFDAIVKSGVHLFGGLNVSLRLVKGDQTEEVASTLPLLGVDDRFPLPVDDDRISSSRSILRRDVVQIPDLFADDRVSEEVKKRAERRGYRAVLSAPMLREGRAIGAITVMRASPGRFTDKEVALLKTFADQAVIAIENVRLFKETKEALEQQTATADILSVISSSPTDLQPVFDAILEKAIRLCDAHMGNLGLYDGEMYQTVAQRGGNPEYAKYVIERGLFRPPPGSGVARMIAKRQPIHIADRMDSPDYRDRLPGTVKVVELGGARTYIAVPMLKEGRVVGGITIYRPEVRPFTQKQIDLVSTFANQAVIAIENVRLFNETKEALQRQTSIAEILRVISSTPTDVMPVLEAVTHRAAQLCDAPDARLFLVDGDTLKYVVGFGELKGVSQTLPFTRGSVVGRAIMDESAVHIEDLAAALDDFPDARGPQQQFGNRTTLAVPLVRENKAFGAILLRRREVRPFSEKQIELVKTFADQATIAIENVRLFNEIQDKSRQLEVASRHKSQFLANMSHELRTPLNAILGYTELVLDGIYGDVSEKVRDVMGRVDKSGRHLLGLINDVLDLSKIEAGQLTLSLADYSLTDVVQTVCTAVESLAAEKKLALKVALASDLPRGRGDDRRLTQVLLNLVGNAIKFTDAGEVRLEARCADGAFVVSVADTGPGISEADQQRIFEEFQQVDDSATRKKGGTGLGLSIARRIIELHGGRIQVESAPGRGSTFTVTLPIRVERQASSL